MAAYEDSLSRVPVTRDMAQAVDDAAYARRITISEWMRLAVQAQLDREQAARLDLAQEVP